MNFLSSFLVKIERGIFNNPRLSLSAILLLTVYFAIQIPALKMYSEFADLLPQKHPYIQLHNEVRDSFGGANNVIIAVEVEEGDIFTNKTLRLVDDLTNSVDSLPSINHNLIKSLTHRTTRKVWLTSEGDINSEPYYDPLKQGYSEGELEAMRQAVKANPQVFGIMVSPNLKAALIKGTLNEGRLNYPEVFAKIREMLEDAQLAKGVKIYAAGQPVLVGWVHSYLLEVIQIFLLTAAILLALLVVYFRRFYAILVPLIGITISSIWGLGVISLLGYNLDPLTMVIPFLVSARALSHGVQLVQRYNDELDASETGSEAARRTFEGLFRPGSLGVVSDATGIFLISLGSIPINTKLAHYASLWALSVVVTVLIAVPLMLSLIPKQKVINNRNNPIMRLMSMVGERLVVPKTSVITLVSLLVLTIIGGIYASRVQIGESEPGSPILYRNHDYNVSAKAINELFPGSEELIVVARTDEPGGMKRPEVLRAIKSLQTYMMTDPVVGGVKALPSLVEQVNRLIHSDDPRWLYIPDDPAYAGGLLFTYMASSPIPGALQEFVSPDEDEASIVVFYKDHKGTTIRRAFHMLKTWINDPANQVEGLRFELAGGIIGVTAAGNEAAFETNMVVLPLVLLLIFAFVTIFYMTFHSGFLMLAMMTFATTLTYAYMGIADIGINTNTVPIIAIGVGVGIDYSIYMMDRIREMAAKNGNNLDDAIRSALRSAGLAICFTAITLVCGVIIWKFVSSLRFQADAALLLCVMLALNAIAALLLVPAWIRIFKPKFITQQNINRVM